VPGEVSGADGSNRLLSGLSLQDDKVTIADTGRFLRYDGVNEAWQQPRGVSQRP
jgi:hypothetical protein